MHRLRVLLCGSVLVASQATSPSVRAATLPVQPNGQGFFPTLQSAIDAASPGDTVLAFPGTYSGLGNRDLDFQGKPICLLGRDGSAATTIDCEYQGRGALFISGENRTACMSGFRIIHGGGSTRLTSGGIRCEYSSPTLEDLVITNSEVSYYGGIGAIYSSLLLTNSIIESNAVLSSGGALGLTWPGSAEIRDCIFSSTAGGGYGGGAVVHNTAAHFENVHFVGNSAGVAGGALQCEDSAVILIHCYFLNNEARDGGAIAMRGTTLTLQDCTFIGNYATRWGGALYYDELGDPSGGLVENCDFRGNRANAGSAILVHELGNPTLRGLTIVGNYGTAIDCLYGTVVSIENCLIADNYLAYGISIVDTDGVSVSCCNVWGNEGGNYGGLLEDQTGLNGNLSVDPLFCDSSYETLGLDGSSPCLPENNTCGVLMGNHGAECTLTAVGAPAPSGVALEANYPNPFNPSTTIPFSLSAPTTVTLGIYDLKGRLVAVLAQDRGFPSGRHELRWDGRDAADEPAPSGVYFYRLDTPGSATARPMLLVK